MSAERCVASTHQHQILVTAAVHSIVELVLYYTRSNILTFALQCHYGLLQVIKGAMKCVDYVYKLRGLNCLSVQLRPGSTMYVQTGTHISG